MIEIAKLSSNQHGNAKQQKYWRTDVGKTIIFSTICFGNARLGAGGCNERGRQKGKGKRKKGMRSSS
eukprot:763664-Hanusia_phi.AAC.4